MANLIQLRTPKSKKEHSVFFIKLLYNYNNIINIINNIIISGLRIAPKKEILGVKISKMANLIQLRTPKRKKEHSVFFIKLLYKRIQILTSHDLKSVQI